MSSMDSLVPDRPLQFGDMLGATFRYMRGNPAATLGVGALLATATSTVQGVMLNGFVFGSNRGADLEKLLAGNQLSDAELQKAIDGVAELAPYLAVAGIVQTIVQFLAMGVMTLGMVRAMQGGKLRPSELWRAVPWRRILGINLAVFVAVLVAGGIPFALALIAPTPVAIVALALALGIGFMVAVASTLAVPASIVDGLGVRESIGAALVATRTAIFRTSALIVGSILFWTLAGDVIGSPIGAILGSLSGGSASASGAALSTMVTGIVGGAITLPASSAMAVLIYVDRKRRMRPSSW